MPSLLYDEELALDLKPAVPAYTPAAVQLVPITPSLNPRYDSRPRKPYTQHRKISSRQTCGTLLYLPPDWQSLIHPEGQPIFYNASLRLTTDSYIHRPEVLERICAWYRIFYANAAVKKTPLSSDLELYLRLGEAADVCFYYIIDHKKRSVLWLDDAHTNDLGLPESVSPAHLETALEEQYWAHVEYFPLQLQPSAVEQLASTLGQYRVDLATSASSTVPWSAERCAVLHQLVQQQCLNAPAGDLNAAWTTARLWGEIARHRFINYHGEEYARLSRDQLVDSPPKSSSLALRWLLHATLLGATTHYTSELEDLVIDNVLYTESWQGFMMACIRDWQHSFAHSLSLVLLNSLLLALTSMSVVGQFNVVGHFCLAISWLASVAGVMSAIVLVDRHRKHTKASSLIAIDYLSLTGTNVDRLSALYALPSGLFRWALVALICNGLLLILYP